MAVTPSGTVMDRRPVASNTARGSSVRPVGSSISVKEEHCMKVPAPRDFRVSGSSTRVSLVQSRKASVPMAVIPSGITISCSPHCWKQVSGIFVRPSLSRTWASAGQ